MMKNNNIFYIVYVFLIMVFPISAEADAGDPCTVANKIYTNESPSAPSLICDGSVLQILQSAKTNPVAKGIGTDNPVTLLTIENATNPVVTIGSSNDNGTPAIRLIEGMSLGGAGNKGFDITLDGASNEMRIDRYENGFVSTLVRFDRDDDFVRIDGELGIGKNPDANIALDIAGDIEYAGTLTDISDRRMKHDIKPLPKGQLDHILALQGMSFKMNDDLHDKEEYGFIAQDVQPIFPLLIHGRSEGTLSLNYIGLIAPMVEAIKEQHVLMQSLKQQNIILSQRIQNLENHIYKTIPVVE